MIFDIQNTLMGTVANGVPSGLALNTGGAGTYTGAFSYDQWGGQASLPTDAIGNTINIDPGLGKEVKVVFMATTAIQGGGGMTIQFQLVSCDDAAETTNVTVLNAGQVWTQARLAALNQSTGLGLVERLVIPPSDVRRFIAIQYVVGVAALTQGAVFAGIVVDEAGNIPTT